ncbi:MAG: hypothetical protein ACR2JE_07900 [Acidobacteriaceae bacterium]
MTEKPLAFLVLLKLLETAVGHQAKHALLEPFPCLTIKDGQTGIPSIQNAGKIIAQHVGLGDLTFVIAVATQEPSTAGHIELRQGSREVFVELSPDICDSKDAVLATLSHEVSHKFLHTPGVRNGWTQLEQEFLTDVTAVYLGMGKIMLNGCECQSSEWSTQGGRTIKTTRVLKTGYISKECFAFVYRLICEMRQIPADQFLSGLSDSARHAVLKCEREYKDWFSSDYHDHARVGQLTDALQSAILECQERAAQRDRALRKAQQELLQLSSTLRDSHSPLLDAKLRVARLLEPHPNPSLRYVNYLETREAVDELTSKSTEQIDDLRLGWKHIEAISAGARAQTQANPHEVVECPIDKAKLRVPTGKRRLLVTCSSCKYRFIVSTEDETEQPLFANAKIIAKRRVSPLRTLLGCFGR